MKRLACILLSFCPALTACTENDPVAPDLGEKRLVRARLTGVPWQLCCRKAEILEICPDPVNSREKALELLSVAGGRCLDKAVRAVENHAPEDLAAAYLVRAERNDDPTDLLRALETATGFNRALALQKLGLNEEAIEAWSPVTEQDSTWGREARAFRRHLVNLPHADWRPEHLEAALQRRDRAAVTKIVRAFPTDTAEYFERFNLSDLDGARLFAEVLSETGERHPQAVIDAMVRPTDPRALKEGLHAFRKRDFERAAALLERAGNPLHLTARVMIASQQFGSGRKSLALLDDVAPKVRSEYRDLSYRIQLLRANALELESQYLQALAVYERALGIAGIDSTRFAASVSRRSQNYSVIGSPGDGLREALRALGRLHQVANLDARHQTYGAAAMAVHRLGFPEMALQYQKRALELPRRRAEANPELKHHLAVALRHYADLLVAAGQESNAMKVLADASELAKAAPQVQPLLQMRLKVVTGQALLREDPRAAVTSFTEAIELAKQQDSSYRAVLHFHRSAAHRYSGDSHAADADTATALSILREEAQGLVDTAARGEFEEFWNAYFSRFQDIQRQFIERRIDAGDHEGAFLLAEQTRAFEPLQLVLRSRSVPPGYRPIETKADLDHHLANLPEDTVILHYLVLPRRTYTWVLVRGKMTLVPQRAGAGDVQRWAENVAEAAEIGPSDTFARDTFNQAMRAAYAELFRTPLATAPSKTRIVIVPDGPMHGLPFAGLEGNSEEGFLIDRASITTAASTSLYFYSLARDQQFPRENPSVFIVGDPAFDDRIDLDRLPYALKEAEELRRDYYPGAKVLTGADATVERFLAFGRNATIIHFAGHGIPNPQQPWKSRLLLAPGPNDSGELTAEQLMQELSELERTRLVVLGACSTAAGNPVGPQGLAPLVRPLIAANVPGIVGTLWDVGDATAKQLLGSLHCHYRRGDDVAVALQHAQSERLRDKDHALAWAPYQVVGHAGSPYARPAASEETRSDHVCTEDSLHRPDGLHSQ